MESLAPIISSVIGDLREIIFPDAGNQSGQLDSYGTGKLYPLINHTAVAHLTPQDFIRPGIFGAQQSTLPFFQVLINVAAFCIWLVVFVYFWKLIYYPAEDPYATPSGSAAPHLRRVSNSFTNELWEFVSNAIEAI